ncbi:hypothetical protein O181_012101 [Austropuccinia psidii MF-1]|uniref:Uncharacterized protein n=1 Tax=Austropuccinia psidii MF-1 TaxID=1389203 RepID=A0A9Q3BX39_9BASI|nr:hypothetical protein [Austropuccinia psidii MF-1]
MSHPARYPPSGPSRYPPFGPYPPITRRFHPATTRVGQEPSTLPTPPPHHPTPADGAYWPGQGLPPDDMNTTPFHNTFEDELGCPPMPWGQVPRDLQMEAYEQGWGPSSARPGAFQEWCAWPPGADHPTTRRPFAQLDNYGPTLEHRQNRHKWREEILRGDPEKLMADHAIESSQVVISFITRRASNHPQDQAEEILFFRPRRKDPTRLQYAQDLRGSWTFMASEAAPLVALDADDVILPSEEISKKSITGLIPNIDPDKDLRLVRRSKPLRWDSTTILESFLYRLAEGKEDPESEAGKDLLQRLDPNFHYWTLLRGFQQVVDSDLVATAMIAVCLPQPISMGFDDIFADQDSRPDQLSLKALDVMYLCVQGLYARTAFLYYPIPPPPVGQSDFELCVKRRIWAYWTEVVAWHLSHLRSDAQVSISYALLKPLTAIKPSVDDNSVTLDGLEKHLINAIAAEADRSRNAARILMREGVSEILYNPKFAPEDAAFEKMHLITTSSSSTVYNVISKIITHVLSRKSSLAEASKSITNRKIMDLKITIAESRPLSEGVALAMRLSRVIDSYTEYRDRAAKNARRTSAVPSVADLGPAALDNNIQARLRQLMLDTEQMRSPNKLQQQTLGLAHLLAEMDAKKEKKEPQVTIELITDAAAVSTIMASGNSGAKPIVVLSADRVLSNGNVVNKVGSAQMAWASKLSGGVVLVLCRADRIHSTTLPVPAKISNSSDELVAGWKSIVGEKPIEDLITSSHVKISNPTYEDVSYENVTGYVTELGFMSTDLLMEFSNMRTDLENVIWPPTLPK